MVPLRGSHFEIEDFNPSSGPLGLHLAWESGNLTLIS